MKKIFFLLIALFLVSGTVSAQKKPVKKSKFQKRLEDMAKQRGLQMPKK